MRIEFFNEPVVFVAEIRPQLSSIWATRNKNRKKGRGTSPFWMQIINPKMCTEQKWRRRAETFEIGGEETLLVVRMNSTYEIFPIIKLYGSAFDSH